MAAEEVARQIQARLTLGKDALPKAKTKLPTLEEYYEQIKKSYLKTATRVRTQVSYESSFNLHILPKLGAKRLDEISKSDMRNLIASLVDKDLARPSIRIIIAELCAVLNHAVEDELIASNPAARCSKF